MKEKVTYNYNMYYEKFKKDVHDEADHEYYKFLYSNIKNDYKELIKNNKIDIRIEKIRLNSRLAHKGSNSIAIVISFVVLAFTLLADGVLGYINASTSIDSSMKPVLMYIFPVAFALVIIFFLYKHFNGYNDSDSLNTIRLRVLDEIEKEQQKIRVVRVKNDNVNIKVAISRRKSKKKK